MVTLEVVEQRDFRWRTFDIYPPQLYESCGVEDDGGGDGDDGWR